MAASDHMNPNQLRLFMTPKEIMGQYKPLPGDRFSDESESDFWDRKANEAEESGLTSSIVEKGVKLPVSLNVETGEVVGGHHRIAAAHAIDPNMSIPVNYEESARHARGYEYNVEIQQKYDLEDLPDTTWVRDDPSDSSHYGAIFPATRSNSGSGS